MPPRKPVEALQQLCIQAIIRNIETYYVKEVHSLPTSLLEELIKFTHDDVENKVIENKVAKLSIHYKIKMMTENITRLSFSFCIFSRVGVAYVLKSIPKHFKSLKQFICEDDGELMHHEIVNLIHSFPNIIDLKLNSSSVNDDILEAIGDNCPNLECLELRRARVTDDGVSRFCNSKSHGSNITHLTLEGSYTIKGCLTVFQNLKRLRDFTGVCVIKTFKKLFQDLDGSQELPLFELRELSEVGMENIPTGFLSFLTKCFPNVSNLHLSMSENLSNDLTELKKCDKILPLKISINNKQFSMSDLTHVGSNVTSLSIYGSDVDLEVVGQVCPNLKKLELNRVTYQPIVNLKSKNFVIPFRKLHNLSLSSPTLFSIHIPQLKFLFQNCVDLEELELSLRSNTDDDVFKFISVIHEINPLTHLTHFTVYGSTTVCKLITLELLKMENNLQFVTTADLSSSPEFKCEIESYIKENNLGTHVQMPRKPKFTVICSQY